MFSGQSPTKVNIDEANKHLQMLHDKVSDLEQGIAEKTSHFEKRELDLREEYDSTIGVKDAELAKKSDEIEESHKMIVDLTEQLKVKEGVIQELQEKSRILDEIAQYGHIFENILSCLGKVKSNANFGNTSASGSESQSQTFSVTNMSLPMDNTKTPKLKEWPKPNIDLSPTITQMARTYRRSTKSRQFSISEDESLDDSEPIAEDVFSRPKPEKELYL